ncbi:MAG: hypothetical protein WAN89_02705 [Lawsonella sp.]
MPIFVPDNISEVWHGSQPISEVWHGSDLVWQKTVGAPYEGTYPRALWFVLTHAGKYSPYVVNRVDDTFTETVTVRYDRRVGLSMLVRPGSTLHMAPTEGGTHYLEVTVTNTNYVVKVVTDTGLTAESSFSLPSEQLDNCLLQWFPLSVQVVPRGKNIDVYVEDFADRGYIREGTLLKVGGFPAGDYSVSGAAMHGVCAGGNSDDTVRHFYDWNAFDDTYGEVANSGVAASRIYPNPAITYGDGLGWLRDVCTTNTAYEIVLAETAERTVYYAPAALRSYYTYFGSEFDWVAPAGVDTVEGYFVSRGGWGSPAIPGLTAANDKQGTPGAEGQAYSKTINFRRGKLIIPPLNTVPPREQERDASGNWVWDPPMGGLNFATPYELPPGITHEPVFSSSWFPYFEGTARPSSGGPIGSHPFGVEGLSQATSKRILMVPYVRMVSWTDKFGIYSYPENSALPRLKAGSKTLYSSLNNVAGAAGAPGGRWNLGSGLNIDKQTLPPSSPGPAAVYLKYQF